MGNREGTHKVVSFAIQAQIDPIIGNHLFLEATVDGETSPLLRYWVTQVGDDWRERITEAQGILNGLRSEWEGAPNTTWYALSRVIASKMSGATVEVGT
ncbi:MAG TPA: hypothetical protein VJL08_03710 [Dehalococcoidia bacterium]|nr:hypothetical protein [Dehalococcoidia bacterium]